jgi:diguanylate cyclase (GGDEF)-like protein/PAS domain S-box-containing protein
MVDQYILFILISALSTVIPLCLGILAFIRRRTPLKDAFVILMVSISGWSLTITLTRLALLPETAVFWAKITYIFVGCSSIAWFRFAYFYLGNDFIHKRRYFAALCLIPLITCLLVFQNEHLGLVWKTLTFHQVGPFWYFVATYGVWFWVQLIYGYALSLVAAVALILRVFSDSRLFRWQAIIITLGAALPILWNAISIFRLLPGIRFDITPVGFALAGVFFGIGIFRFHILDLLPVAYQALIESMTEGVLVLEDGDRIAAVNPAAGQILRIEAGQLVGRPIAKVLPAWENLCGHPGDWVEISLPGPGGEDPSGPRIYEAAVTILSGRRPLKLDGQEIGRLLVLRDITVRKRSEQELTLHRDQLSALVTEQTMSLRNANASLRETAAALRQEVQERVQAEENLRRERDILSHIMETSPVGIIQLDEYRQVIYANTQAAEMVGLEVKEFIRLANQNELWTITDLEGNLLQREELPLFNVLLTGQPISNCVFSTDTVHKGRIMIELNAAALHDSTGRNTGVIATLADITERIGTEKRLKHLATHDSLTGLPNRVMFTDCLAQAVANADRGHLNLAVVFIDLDNFKSINDAFSHDQGDQLLKIIVGRIQGCIRASDTLARHGGDEFVILLENIASRTDIPRVIQKILDAVSQPVQIQHMEVVVTTSVGLAVYPDENISAANLLQCADIAMYHAKSMGKNSYSFYSSAMEISAYEDLELVSDLRRALARGEFVLHYQPVIDLDRRQVVAVEALIRWQHPTLGLLGPDRFIRLAEKSQLINAVGEWVLEESCRQGKAWLDQGLPPVRVHVNLSERQMNLGLALRVARVLEMTALPAGCLELELTEEIVYAEVPGLKELLDQLHRLGVRLAIDDFGSGQTSLSQLSNYPFDTVKIDRKMTADLETNQQTRVVVSGLVGIANQLGMTVIAEGVETIAQVDFYHQYGCSQFQGWYFHRAVPASVCAELIRTPREKVQRDLELPE